MSRGDADAATALLRALGDRFAGFGGAFRLEALASRPWASVTFSGARHEIAISLEGQGAAAAADLFLVGLDEAEFELAGHILADIAVAGDERSSGGDSVRLRIEALTVRDD